MNKKEYTQLEKLLSSKRNSEMKAEYVHGYLSAILCARELIVPSSWMPLLLEGGKDTEFETMDEAQALIGLIMKLYNEIARSIMDRSFAPLYSKDRAKPSPADAETWSKGFILGLNLWSEDFAADETARSFVLPVFLLADSDKLLDKSKVPSDDIVNDLKMKALEEIPGNILKLRRYYQPELDRPHVKAGRNDLCPCGSGKKYKKCCGTH